MHFNTPPISTLSTQFNLPLTPDRLMKFRGALADLVGLENDLFHNHDNRPDSKQDHYQRYPLVQYRIQRGKAGVFGINQGAEALEQLAFTSRLSRFRLEGRAHPLRLLAHYRDRGFRPEVLPDHDRQVYRIQSYLPLSREAFQVFRTTPSLIQRIELLERLLCNHLVSFAYGVGWALPESPRLRVLIHHVLKKFTVHLHGQPRVAFHLEFSVNAKLPLGVGIGPKVAFGFGVIRSVQSLVYRA